MGWVGGWPAKGRQKRAARTKGRQGLAKGRQARLDKRAGWVDARLTIVVGRSECGGRWGGDVHLLTK